MVALMVFLLRLVTSHFKSRSRLEAENAVLRQQLKVLQRKVRGRVRVNNSDRLFLSPALSLVSIDTPGPDDHPAGDPGALASCWFSPLLALEITLRGWSAADCIGFAGIDPAHEY